jgi:hypothetical protein
MCLKRWQHWLRFGDRVVTAGPFMTCFYRFKFGYSGSPDYIFPFGLGALGWIILSSPPSRWTFITPWSFDRHVMLGC